MSPIDSTNDQNICVELFKATFTQGTYQGKKLETTLCSLLY